MKRLFAATSIFALMLGGAALAQTSSYSNQGSTSHQGSMSSQGKMMNQSSSSSPQEVKQAQTELKQMGLYRGQVDGIIGPETKSALSQYQKENGLPQTATLDQQTLSHLQQGGTASGSSSPSGSSGSMQHNGSSSGTPQNSSPKH